MQSQTEDGLGVDRQLNPVSIQEIVHFVVGDVGVHQDHVHERIQRIRMLLLPHILLAPVLDPLDLFVLVALQPFNTPFQHTGNNCDIILRGDLQTVHDDCRRMWPRMFARSAEPAPAAVGTLHGGESFQPFLDHQLDFGFVEHRVAVESLPAFGPLDIVANFLGVQVCSLGLNVLQVELHVQQDLLGDDRGQKPVQRLFRASIRVIDHVGQRIHHRSRQRRRITSFQLRFVLSTLGRNLELYAAGRIRRANGPTERFRLQHSVHIHGECHLHRVRLFVRKGLDRDAGHSLSRDCDSPVDTDFTIGRNHDLLFTIATGNRHGVPFQFDRDHRGLGPLEVVVDIGRNDDFVLFDEEAGSLQSHQQVLLGGDFGLTLAHLGSQAHRPGLHFPACQAFGHLETDFSQTCLVSSDGCRPEGGIGKIRTDCWRGHVAWPCFTRRSRPVRLGQSVLAFTFRLGRIRRKCSHGCPRCSTASTTSQSHPAIHGAALRHRAGKLHFHHSAERTQVPHADFAILQQIAEHAIQRAISLRMMLSAPLPEEFLDFRNVGTAGNVFDTLVVNRHHGRTDERLAGGIRQLHLDLRIRPRLVFVLRRKHLHVDHTLFRGNHNLTHFLMVFSVSNCAGFNIEIGHVLLDHGHLFDGALAL